jgi:hypothetical protein
MDRALILATVLVLEAITVSSQSRTNPAASPKDIVEQFLSMAREGTLLTPDGWDRAAALFYRPGPPPSVLGHTIPLPPKGEIYVFDDGFGVEREPVKRTATFDAVDFLVWAKPVGRIDSKLRYSRPTEAEMRSYKPAYLFHLVLTNKYWKLGPDGKLLEETTGPPEWRISPQLSLWTTVNPAILYVRKMRDKTTDPVIKKNADKTLAILKKLRD